MSSAVQMISERSASYSRPPRSQTFTAILPRSLATESTMGLHSQTRRNRGFQGVSLSASTLSTNVSSTCAGAGCPFRDGDYQNKSGDCFPVAFLLEAVSRCSINSRACFPISPHR